MNIHHGQMLADLETANPFAEAQSRQGSANKEKDLNSLGIAGQIHVLLKIPYQLPITN
ncbi:MAG: hypothetical protein JWN83_885 [Chitinophagaceae bacterium]|nr:hypothetical protein [Chitinophagaceae bacterium]